MNCPKLSEAAGVMYQGVLHCECDVKIDRVINKLRWYCAKDKTIKWYNPILGREMTGGEIQGIKDDFTT